MKSTLKSRTKEISETKSKLSERKERQNIALKSFRDKQKRSRAYDNYNKAYSQYSKERSDFVDVLLNVDNPDKVMKEAAEYKGSLSNLSSTLKSNKQIFGNQIVAESVESLNEEKESLLQSQTVNQEINTDYQKQLEQYGVGRDINELKDNPNYIISYDNQGNITKIEAKPVQYKKQSNTPNAGGKIIYSTYTPYVAKVKNGKLVEETKFGVTTANFQRFGRGEGGRYNYMVFADINAKYQNGKLKSITNQDSYRKSVSGSPGYTSGNYEIFVKEEKLFENKQLTRKKVFADSQTGLKVVRTKNSETNKYQQITDQKRAIYLQQDFNFKEGILIEAQAPNRQKQLIGIKKAVPEYKPPKVIAYNLYKNKGWIDGQAFTATQQSNKLKERIEYNKYVMQNRVLTSKMKGGKRVYFNAKPEPIKNPLSQVKGFKLL
jgi:hypothetical protein